ncbi:hypothetical protein ACOSP7_007008 [Xanthoceras sorbifolium]
MSLVEPERPVALMNAELQVLGQQKLALCLAGRLLATKQVNREAFRAIIPKIWRTTQEVEIEILRDNIFGFHFRNQMDRNRALVGGPWSFDGSLLILEEPYDMGRFLGKEIGPMREIDTGASSDCLGKYIRVRVVIDIKKPLQHFLKVNMGGSGKAVVMLLWYERLKEYCFEYGFVGHSIRECAHGDGSRGGGGMSVRVIHERQKKRLAVHDESEAAGHEGDTGCEADKIVTVDPFITERCEIEAGVVLEDPQSDIMGANAPYVFVAKEPCKVQGKSKVRVSTFVGNTKDLRESLLWVREANMAVELADAKSRQWKRRARERLDRDLVMDPYVIGGKQISSDLSENVVAPKKIRRTDSEVATLVNSGGCVNRRYGRHFIFEEGWVDEEECCRIVEEQRSRVAWLKSGDQNTHFFRSQASKRKKINEIKGLLNLNAKVLANRVRGVIGELTVETQSAFVPKRSILDNAIVGFECMHALKRKHKGKALLGKQCWRLLWDPTSLAARVLKNCYFPAMSLLKAKKSSSGSFVWKSLLWGHEVLSKGSRWRIGRGSSVLVYQYWWLQHPSTFKVIFPPILGLDLTMDRLKTVSGGWSIPLIKQNFLFMDVEAVLSLPLGLTTVEDSLMWHHTKEGMYTVKSGYLAAISSAKIKVLLWRASLNWIPSMVNLEARRVPVEAYYPLVMSRQNMHVNGQNGSGLDCPVSSTTEGEREHKNQLLLGSSLTLAMCFLVAW